MAVRAKFTRIPKTHALIRAGVPAEVIPTYAAVCDYSDNRSGLCWPAMTTLANTLGRSVRTVQRHLHLLKELGLVEFVERRRQGGRFSSYLYRVLHVALFKTSTTGHERRVGKASPNIRRTKQQFNGSKNTPEDKEEQRKRDAARRREGYEWLFR